MTLFEILQLVFIIATGIATPALLLVVTRGHSQRERKFDDLHATISANKDELNKKLEGDKAETHAQLVSISTDMKHLDECFDDLRVKVAGEMATRTDLTAARVDMQSIITRMREAVSSEIRTACDRIKRIEDIELGRKISND